MIFRPVLARCSSVRICSVSDTLHRQSSTPHPVRSSRRGLSGIECSRCSVSNVRACVSCLAWSALPPVMCSRSGCAGWGWGLHLWGIWVEPGVGWPTPRVEKIQKRRFPCLPTPSFLLKNHPTPYCQSQKFPAKIKRPLQRVYVLCYTCLRSLEREESVK